MSRSPLSTRIVDFVCIAFAVFTLCCHGVVAAGGTLTTLIGVTAAAGVVALGLRLALGAGDSLGALHPQPQSRSRSESQPESERISPLELETEPETEPEAEPETECDGGEARTRSAAPEPAAANDRLTRLYSLLAFARPVAGAWVALSLGASEDKLPLWWGWVLVTSGAAFLVLRPLPWRTRPPAPRAQDAAGSASLEFGLFALALLCAGIALVAHRPDVDDSFYLNLAVGAVDRLSWPLLSGDTLHGIEGIPLHLSVYKLHSYELFNAVLSRISGLPAIVCFHIVSTAVGAALVPLAFAALWRQLTPRQWLWGVAATLLVLVAAGETHRSYGNFSLVRMWQGKAIALYVFLPLVHAYAIRFALEPGRRNALLLAAAQVAALGCSASLVWVAPAGAAIALASALALRPHSLRTFALGLSTSAYLVIAGLAVKAGMSSVPAMARAFDPAAELGKALEVTLGSDALLIVSLGAILCAWACWPAGLARRYAIAFPLAVGALLLNPYFADFVHRHLTGPSYWRAMWALPVPVLLALVLTAPVRIQGPGLRRLAGPALCLALLLGFAAFVPNYSTLSPKNRVSLQLPQLKIDSLAWNVARVLSESVPARARVVVPHRIARWLTTFHDHPYPLVVGAYLNHAESQLAAGELDLRRSMTSLVSGQSQDPATSAEEFERGLAHFDIAAVSLRKTGQTSALRPLLQSSGFERTLDGDSFEIWLRR